MSIDDELDAQEREVDELESLAVELAAAVAELDEIELQLDALAGMA